MTYLALKFSLKCAIKYYFMPNFVIQQDNHLSCFLFLNAIAKYAKIYDTSGH